jgi:hypothetical protein
MRRPSGSAVRWCAFVLLFPLPYTFLIAPNATVPVTFFFLLLAALIFDYGSGAVSPGPMIQTAVTRKTIVI